MARPSGAELLANSRTGDYTTAALARLGMCIRGVDWVEPAGSPGEGEVMGVMVDTDPKALNIAHPAEVRKVQRGLGQQSLVPRFEERPEPIVFFPKRVSQGGGRLRISAVASRRPQATDPVGEAGPGVHVIDRRLWSKGRPGPGDET
jgi:hypothetical protein